MPPLDNAVEIETPEHVRFRYRAAGPARRALAYLLDLLIRAVIVFVLAVLLQLATGRSVGDASKGGGAMGVLLVLLFLLEWGYYLFFDLTRGGASPGKRALSLRVVKEGGHAVGFADSLLRNLLRAADFLPVGYALGLLVMAGDRRFRRLGDRVAGTMVIVEEPARAAEVLALAVPPDDLARLPQRPPLLAGEREAIELFLRRADLSDARRAELAGLIAPMLAARMGVTPPDPVRFLEAVHQRGNAGAHGG